MLTSNSEKFTSLLWVKLNLGNISENLTIKFFVYFENSEKKIDIGLLQCWIKKNFKA